MMSVVFAVNQNYRPHYQDISQAGRLYVRQRLFSSSFIAARVRFKLRALTLYVLKLHVLNYI